MCREYKEPSERLYKFDYMKAFLIFCVVLGHITYWFPGKSYTLHCTSLWIYSFHMPAFIFVSGLFSKNTIYKHRWNKIVSYVILYFFMKGLIFFVDIFRGKAAESLTLFSADGVEWFALALFWWYTITILVQCVHPVYVMIVTVCLSIISGYSDEIGVFMVLQRTLVFYPFFYLGYILDVNQLVKTFQIHKKIKFVSAITIFIFSYIFVYFNYQQISFWLDIFRGRFSYNELFDGINYLYGGLYRLLAYMISIVMILVLITIFVLLPIGQSRIISYIGRGTLSTYVFHSPIISLVFTITIGIKNFMLETNLFFTSIILSVFLVIFTVIPVFQTFCKKIMYIPLRG